LLLYSSRNSIYLNLDDHTGFLAMEGEVAELNDLVGGEFGGYASRPSANLWPGSLASVGPRVAAFVKSQ
jgi:hypothetical protein